MSGGSGDPQVCDASEHGFPCITASDQDGAQRPSTQGSFSEKSDHVLEPDTRTQKKLEATCTTSKTLEGTGESATDMRASGILIPQSLHDSKSNELTVEPPTRLPVNSAHLQKRKNISELALEDQGHLPPIPALPPLVPSWCGHCAPSNIKVSGTAFPDQDKSLREKASYKRLVSTWDDTVAAETHCCDVDHIQMPALPERSKFSSAPHERFPHLSVREMNRLELQIIQHKIKLPLEAEAVEMDTKEKHRVQRMREDLEAASVRNAARKPFYKRNEDEVRLLMRYLQKHEFFRDLPSAILAQAVGHIGWTRQDAGETLFEAGTAMDSMRVILSGEIALEAQSGGTTPGHKGTLSWNYFSTGKVLGVVETLEEEKPVYRTRKDPCHMYTAVAKLAVEVLEIPCASITPLLDADAIQKRNEALRTHFPLLKGKTAEEVAGPSRVDRGGGRVAIVNLFDFLLLPANHVLYRQYEKPLMHLARMTFLISGSVQMKSKGRVVEEAGKGALLGDEVLRKELYATSAIVRTDALVLTISAADWAHHFQSRAFLPGQFLEGRQRMAEAFFQPPVKEEEAPLGDDEVEQATPRCIRRARPNMHMRNAKFINETLRTLKGPTQRIEDLKNLTSQEWKRLQPKRMPHRVAPIDSETENRKKRDFSYEPEYSPRYFLLKGKQPRPPLTRAPIGPRSPSPHCVPYVSPRSRSASDSDDTTKLCKPHRSSCSPSQRHRDVMPGAYRKVAVPAFPGMVVGVAVPLSQKEGDILPTAHRSLNAPLVPPWELL